ncbi:unnamed protein product [Schistosoma turkestanicum]|nr:unnamed protein product [Schistosoma turkestanicum]
MSAESGTLLYKGTATSKVGNETVLGTPVPVAHSTVGYDRFSTNHKHSRMHLNEMQQTSPAFEKQTYVIKSSSRNQNRDIPSSNKEELSILNIDTIKGLSDSVLDRSLQGPKYNEVSKKLALENKIKKMDTFNVEQCQSLADLSTEIESEPQKIQFDDEELRMLEEAFSDFDCESSEATAPTRVCETFARQISCKAPEVGEQYSDGNSTSVPSLSSNEGICDVDGNTTVVDQANPSASTNSSHILEVTGLPTLVSKCYSKNAVEKQASSSKNECGQFILRPQNTNYSHLPCLTGLSSVFEVDSTEPKSDNCIQPSLCVTTTLPLKVDQSVTTSPVHTVVSNSSNCANNEPVQSMNINNTLSTQTQLIHQKLPNQCLNPSQKVGNLNNASSLKLKNFNQPDVSQVDISCLHMSDIDGLLDMITAIGKQPEAGKLELFPRQNKLSSHLEKQLMAVRQALTSNLPSNTVDSNKISSNVNGKQSNSSQSKMDALKENIPPVNITNSGQNLTHRRTLFHHPNAGAPPISTNPLANSHSVPTTSENLLVHDGSVISQKDSSSPDVFTSQNVPILSNTNCLIYAGAVCGQIHRQHFLIKHQMDKPTTISFVVHPKSEVFKLVDENGYLISGVFRVHLPPNLEYEVNVAYVAKHPVSWDFGHLLLRSEESKSSTFKVRLIGYTNSSQLVYSCCSKLSSNVYWTVASKVDLSSESMVKNNEKSHQASLRSTKCELTSNISGCYLASINISNFGSRSAWVCARVEWIDRKTANQNEHEDTSKCGVIIEPRALIVGSKQSQSILITLKPGVKAVRIVFYHGDEVVRYQFRQLCADSNETITKIGKRSSHSRLQLSEILEDFEHEQSIQIVELPPATFSDLRPQDWHQAFIDQVHHCERIFLYIYASNSLNQSSVYSPSSISESVFENSLASVFVQQDAFKHQNSLKPNRHESSKTSSSQTKTRKTNSRETYPTNTYTPNISTGQSWNEKMSLVQPPKLEINPPYTLVFPPCIPTCSTEAQFSVSLKHISHDNEETSSLSLWRVFWSVNPVTDVQMRNITSNSSHSLNKRSTMEQGIFQLLSSESNPLSQYNINNKSVESVGILSTDANNTEFRSFSIPFRFKPTSYCENILIQDWHLEFWLEPYIQSQCHYLSRFSSKDSVTILVTLEGSCYKQATINESPLTHLPIISNYKCPPSKSQCLSDRTSLTTVENPSKTVHIGPIDVIGLPVSFETVDSNSSTTSRSHNILLINRMKTSEAFVKLKPPSPPFYIIEPKEIRFRLLPRSRVRIVLIFRPYTLGKSSSVLGINVEYHKQENLSVEKSNCNSKPIIDSFQVHLFGTMN